MKNSRFLRNIIFSSVLVIPPSHLTAFSDTDFYLNTALDEIACGYHVQIVAVISQAEQAEALVAYTIAPE